MGVVNNVAKSYDFYYDDAKAYFIIIDRERVREVGGRGYILLTMLTNPHIIKSNLNDILINIKL